MSREDDDRYVKRIAQLEEHVADLLEREKADRLAAQVDEIAARWAAERE